MSSSLDDTLHSVNEMLKRGQRDIKLYDEISEDTALWKQRCCVRCKVRFSGPEVKWGQDRREVQAPRNVFQTLCVNPKPHNTQP